VPPSFGIRGLKHWHALSPRAQDRYLEALEVLNISRNEKKAIRTAAREVGIPFESAMRYIRPATERRAGGLVAKKADRLFRPMEVASASGEKVERAVYGSRKARLVGRHGNALRKFLQSGDEEVLTAFRGKRVARVELASDAVLIERMAREGTLGDLEPYPRGVG
jgi:hypothetical protein